MNNIKHKLIEKINYEDRIVLIYKRTDQPIEEYCACQIIYKKEV